MAERSWKSIGLLSLTGAFTAAAAAIYTTRSPSLGIIVGIFTGLALGTRATLKKLQESDAPPRRNWFNLKL